MCEEPTIHRARPPAANQKDVNRREQRCSFSVFPYKMMSLQRYHSVTIILYDLARAIYEEAVAAIFAVR